MTWRQPLILILKDPSSSTGFLPYNKKTKNRSKYSNGALQKHIKTVHDKIKPHHCQVCKKAFGANSTLQKHIIRMHKKSVANQVSKVDKKRSKKSKSSTDKKYCLAKNRLLAELSTLVQDYLHQQGPESKPVKMSMLQS